MFSNRLLDRMREKLGAVNASIAANVGEALWKEVQGAVAQARRWMAKMPRMMPMVEGAKPSWVPRIGRMKV